MAIDFDTPLPLKNTHCSKFDGIAKSFGYDDPDMIPMWVADMDFAAAEPIRTAMLAEVDRGYFGYFAQVESVNRAVVDWMSSNHGWKIEPTWLRYTHGVVAGLGIAIDAFSDPGDEIVVFAPVYHAFYRKIRHMNRKVVESELVERDGQFHMDLDSLAKKLTGSEKALAFCNPHNPGGRMWSVEEIRAVVDFCVAHDLILISDEIHMDLVFPGARHLPTATAAPNCLPRLVVLTAASKGFNTAGGETGIMIVPDDTLRSAVDDSLNDRSGSPNRFGMMMIKAAFSDGHEWSNAVRVYLAENFRIWRDRIGALPGISVMDMQATYLSWVDFSGTGMAQSEIEHRLLKTAKIAASPGPVFGTGGKGHMRFNLAMPRARMIEAIERIEAAFSDLQ